MKKLLITLVILALSVAFAHAQNIEANGLQSGIWEADTVFVTGDVTVQDSLCIQAGTTVVFRGYFGIKVANGASLKAIGNETDSITFTVADTTGFHVYNAGRGGWNGIRLDKANASQFDFCRFQYGKAARDDDQDGGALRIFTCDDVEINHSTLFCNFSREHGGALNAEWSKVTMHDCDILNNLTYTKLDTVYFMYGGGLRFINCDVELVDTDFRYNNGQSAIGGAVSLDSCNILIDRCRFEHNYGINGGGLYLIRSNHLGMGVITNSLFANNTSGHFGGGLAICEASPWISNLTVVNNRSIGVNCGGIFFYQHSDALLWNCIVYGNTNDAPLEEPVQIWTWTYDGSAPQFYWCLIQYGLENISNYEVITAYEGCLDVDPVFLDPEHEDFHLNANSPCIDAGSIYGTDGYDLDGNWRICGNAIDIGAYEYTATSISETNQNDSRLRIIGNPITASSYTEIETENAGVLSVEVYSAEGKLLINRYLGEAHAGTNRFAIGELFAPLSSGTYLIVIRAEGKIFVAKVIK